MAGKTKAYAGLVVITSDTYISGRSVKAGRVEKVDAYGFQLLQEANRCEIFDPENKEHAAALEKSRKEDATRAKAAEEGERQKAA